MYTPEKFQQKDKQKLISMMQQNPFAILTCQSDRGIEAVHLPVVLEQFDSQLTLKAHIAKANPIWQRVKENTEALVIFNGPNDYISPSYYLDQKEENNNVPTWNYIAIHAKGNISFSHNSDQNYHLLTQLTKQSESKITPPWSMTDVSEALIEKMLAEIVGIEIKVHSISGQWKISQNKTKTEQRNVIQALSKNNTKTQSIASIMIEENQ